MYSKIFQLCQLEHSCKEVNVKLYSTCSLQLSYPEDLPSSLSNLDTLRGIVDAGVWVTSGHVLHFLLHIKDEVSREGGSLDKPVSVEHMGVVIRDLEVAIPLPFSYSDIDWEFS